MTSSSNILLCFFTHLDNEKQAKQTRQSQRGEVVRLLTDYCTNKTVIVHEKIKILLNLPFYISSVAGRSSMMSRRSIIILLL